MRVNQLWIICNVRKKMTFEDHKCLWLPSSSFHCCIRDPLMHTSIQGSIYRTESWCYNTTRVGSQQPQMSQIFSACACMMWTLKVACIESLSFREMICYWDDHDVNVPFLLTCERHPTMSAHKEYCDICDWWWCVREEACYRWHISSPLISPQGPPKPVAAEPCSGGKAAVLTVLMCLPRGASGFPPPGQSGQ